MADETTVGGIVGFLRMDADQFHREMARAVAEVEALKGADVGLQGESVKTDEATRRSGDAHRKASEDVDRHRTSTDNLGSSQDRTRGQSNALVTAIVGLGPAILPLGAAALGLGAAFGGMGAAGIAAVVGIKQEMAAGTAVGLSYSAGLGTLKAAMASLGSVAAANVLAPFQTVVADLNARMPALTQIIGEMATVTGRTASALAGGLLSAFVALEPLMRDAAVYVEQLAVRFQGLMSGGGVTTFADYVRSVFPQVMQQVEAIVGAAIRLVAAFAPLGAGTLALIGQLANIINAIPVDVLSALATTAVSVFLGFKAWSALQPLIDGVAVGLARMGVSAEAAAVGVRGLQAAAGLIGVAIAALSFVFTASAEATRANQQAVNDYADALRASNGVIDDSVRAMTAKSLADAGVLEAARQLGFNLSDVTDAALGNASAMDRITQHSQDVAASMRDVSDAEGGVGAQSGPVFAGLTKVNDALGVNRGQLSDGAQKYRDLADATKAVTPELTAQALALQGEASWLGTTSAALQSAEAAQQKHADAARAATLQMQVEGDAVGLLKLALDALNGKTLDLETATTREAQARQNTVKTLTDNKASLDLNTAAGVANRGSIEQSAAAAQAHATAVAKQTGSTEAGTHALGDSKFALEGVLRATGNLTPEVQKYIDKLYAVPPVVQTKVEADTAAAQGRIDVLRTALAQIQSKTVTITTVTSGTGGAVTQGLFGKQVQAEGSIRMGGVKAMAGGGYGDRQAMFSSTPILWGEAGDEAYIPLAPSKRARSTALLAETNRIMGNPLGVGGAAPSGPFEITGTLQSDWGPVQVQGEIVEAIRGQARGLARGLV